MLGKEFNPSKDFQFKAPKDDGAGATGQEDEPIELHGFFVDKDGNLHRGVSTFAYDAEGREYEVGLEWGSDTIYPLAEDEEAKPK